MTPPGPTLFPDDDRPLPGILIAVALSSVVWALIIFVAYWFGGPWLGWMRAGWAFAAGVAQ